MPWSKKGRMVVFSVPEEASYGGRAIYGFACPEGKVYVGYASNFKSRVSNHGSASRRKKDGEWVDKSRWKRAIRRIGWDNLRVVILEFVDESESLKERESHWIAELKAKDPKFGYNSNAGGGGPMAGAYKHTEEAKAKISAGLSKPVTSCKILKEYADGDQLVKFVLYASAHDAERKTDVFNAQISACCNKKQKSAGERYWRYTKKNDKVCTIKVSRIGDKLQPYRRKVVSVSPEGVKQLHEGARAAERTLSTEKKKFYQSAISECCVGKRKTHQGYTFYFASDKEIEEFKKNTKKRKR